MKPPIQRDSPRHLPEQSSVADVLALLLKHRNDARLVKLYENLWLSGRLVSAQLSGPGVSGRQLASGDRWANEIPALFCSHLTSRAVWPIDQICRLLEDNVALFHDEFSAIDPELYRVDRRDKRADLTDGRNWTVYPFYDGFGSLQLDVARRCPGIAEFLKTIPGVGGVGCMAFFSIMNPGTHVPRHTSQLNTRVRYHLGIEVPEGDVRLRIHDQLIAWQQDRCIAIDDSYEHEVFQRSDRRRVIFVLDVPHPELFPEELDFLQSLMRCGPDRWSVDDFFERVAATV